MTWGQVALARESLPLVLSSRHHRGVNQGGGERVQPPVTKGGSPCRADSAKKQAAQGNEEKEQLTNGLWLVPAGEEDAVRFSHRRFQILSPLWKAATTLAPRGSLLAEMTAVTIVHTIWSLEPDCRLWV